MTSRAFPDGSKKNIMACSPGSPRKRIHGWMTQRRRAHFGAARPAAAPRPPGSSRGGAIAPRIRSKSEAPASANCHRARTGPPRSCQQYQSAKSAVPSRRCAQCAIFTLLIDLSPCGRFVDSTQPIAVAIRGATFARLRPKRRRMNSSREILPGPNTTRAKRTDPQ